MPVDKSSLFGNITIRELEANTMGGVRMIDIKSILAVLVTLTLSGCNQDRYEISPDSEISGFVYRLDNQTGEVCQYIFIFTGEVKKKCAN